MYSTSYFYPFIATVNGVAHYSSIFSSTSLTFSLSLKDNKTKKMQLVMLQRKCKA